MNNDEKIVYLVDDDSSVRNSLEALMESVGLNSLSFSSAEAFMKHEPRNVAGCLILDLRMPGMSGLELMEYINEHYSYLPVIFLSGFATVKTSVKALRMGAYHFMEKPFEDQELIEHVVQAIEKARENLDKIHESKEITLLVESLSPREKEVLDLIVAGMKYKEVASRLGTTERTIKAHRAGINAKLGVEAVADLVRFKYIHEKSKKA